MRESLTILACLIIAVLTAALVGPHFVDWSAHRAEVEARLTSAVGATVRVDGPIQLELLPTPRLVLESVHVGGATQGQPRLDAERALFELAVTPLLRGDLRFTDVDFAAPKLRVTIGSDDTVTLPSAGQSRPRHVEIDHMRLSNGTLDIEDPARARHLVLQAIDLDLQGDSLLGPYKGSGNLLLPGNRAARVRFSTSAMEGARLRLKLVSDLDEGPHAEVDGAALFDRQPSGATRVSFQGESSFAGEAAVAGETLAWHATAALEAQPDALSFDKINLHVGPDDRALTASGRGRIGLGPSIDASFTLAAPQIDLDRLFAEGKDTKAAPARFRAFASRLLTSDGPDLPPLPVRVALTSQAVTLGAETLTSAEFGLALKPGSAPNLRLHISGPGRSTIALDGTVETGPAAVFRGRTRAASRDLDALRQWLAKLAPDAAATLHDLPFQTFDVDAQTELSAVSVEARDATIRADRSTFTGTLALTRAVGTEPGRLYVDLASPALDLKSLPDLSAPAAATKDLDLALQLDARAVRVARFGSGMIDAGHITVKLSRTNGEMRLDHLGIDNIGGAGIALTGALGASGGWIDGKLDAARLGDLADLVSRVDPGPLAKEFAARATSLSPARLSLHAQATRDSGGGLAVTSLTLDGTARGTSVDAHLSPASSGEAGRLQAQVNLSAPQTPNLLRQLGLPSLPLTGLGAGRISVEASGPAGGPFDGEAQADLAGTHIGFRGRMTAPSSLGAGLDGTIELTSADASRLMQALAIALPDAGLPRLPLHLSAGVKLSSKGLALSQLSGNMAGAQASGDVALAAREEQQQTRLSGHLAFDRLSLPGLASLVLGSSHPPTKGAIWSKNKFGLALADPPAVTLDLKAARLDLPVGLAASDAALKLDLEPGLVRLDDMQAKIAGGSASGRLTLRRDKDNAFLNGAVELAGVSLQEPSATGALSGHVDFSSTGSSPEGLASGLAGTGRLHIDRLVIPRAAPGALATVVNESDSDKTVLDQPTLASRMEHALDRAAIDLGTRNFDLGMAGGVARLVPADAAAPVSGVEANAEAAVDLTGMTLDQRLTIRMKSLPKDWKDPAPPHISIVWLGPLSAPDRQLDLGALLDGLSARAIAREQERIEAFDEDVRERAFFMRRLKGLRYLHQREEEVERYEAEQKRKAAEAAAAAAARPDASSTKPALGLPVPLLPPPVVIPPPSAAEAAGRH